MSANFQHIAVFPAVAKRHGKETLLTAKVICGLVVFAGGEHGATSISADKELHEINNAWVAYCCQNNASGQANPPRIDQGDLDRVRGTSA